VYDMHCVYRTRVHCIPVQILGIRNALGDFNSLEWSLTILAFYYFYLTDRRNSNVYSRFSDFNSTGRQGRASLIASILHCIVSCYRGDDQPNYADNLVQRAGGSAGPPAT